MTRLYDKAFTAKVAQLIAEGYTIASKPMSGHQGEMARVVFTKDGKFYVLFLEHNCNSQSWDWYNDNADTSKLEPWDTVDLVFGEAEPGFREHYTLWLDHVQVIDHDKFYIVGDFYRNFTTEVDREKALAMRKLSIARGKAHYNYNRDVHEHTFDISDDRVVTAAYRTLKRREGYTTLRKHQIVGVKMTECLAHNNIVVGIRKADGSLKSVTIFSAKSAA